MKLGHALGIFVLGAGLFLLGSMDANAASTKKKKKPPIKKIIDVELIRQLKVTAYGISVTNKDYKGHRAAALKYLKAAVSALAAEAKVSGQMLKATSQTTQPQPVSDAQLRAAIGSLHQIIKEINKVKYTPGRQAAGENIVLAIGQLKLALAVA